LVIGREDVPNALQQCLGVVVGVPGDKVNVAPQGLVEEFQNTTLRTMVRQRFNRP
jgi:hypothetical protein